MTREKLHDPALNAAIGAAYLGWQWLQWSGNPGYVVASYNAGEGAVAKWVKERGGWSLDEFLEAVPFDETRGYTKRVLASYFVYSWLEANRVPRLPLK